MEKVNIEEEYKGPILFSPLEAIKEKCLDCSAYQPEEVELCPCKDCTLWPFRFGTDPYEGE